MKNIKKFAAVLLCLTVISGAAVYFSRPEVQFIIKNLFGSKAQSCQLQEIQISDTESGYVPVKNLKYGSNCTFDQSLMLINKNHPLPEGFDPELEQYEDTDAYINSCAIDSFIEMREHINRTLGSRLLVMSAYRNREEQLEIYNNDDEGTAAKPGYSEHETGLGIDVYIKYYAGMGFIKSEIGRYVNTDCGDFGFIIRYPLGKKNITGFSYEPWHIRYVGLPHSKIIMQNSLTLEEYIKSIEIDCFYTYENYIISKQDGEGFVVPEEYDSIVISPDNLGNYIVTAKIK